MTKIQHRFLDHQIDPETEILIMGTFNPEIADNEAEFFYGRSRNYLWKLLPVAFGEIDLKGHTKQEKMEFIKKHHIDFIDLIEEIEVENGNENLYENIYKDIYIDGKVTRWKNIIDVIDSLPNLKKVCFTRKTFSGIPNIKSHIENIRQHCEKKKILFKTLISPARFYNDNKQTEWTNFLLYDSK
jgi:G:T/U-mismatch repair DNA glycosylase